MSETWFLENRKLWTEAKEPDWLKNQIGRDVSVMILWNSLEIPILGVDTWLCTMRHLYLFIVNTCKNIQKELYHNIYKQDICRKTGHVSYIHITFVYVVYFWEGFRGSQIRGQCVYYADLQYIRYYIIKNLHRLSNVWIISIS